MNVTELLAHMRAVAEQYESDAEALREQSRRDGNTSCPLATRFEGKADGFYVAAAWIEEYLT